jgi:hypothetical protein
MTVAPCRYQICLSIPEEAQKQLLACSQAIQSVEGSLKIPRLHEFCVRIISVEAQPREDIAKIQRAIIEVQKQLEGQNCAVYTVAPCVCQDRTALAFNVQASGLAVGAGYFKHIFSALYGSLRGQEILAEHISPHGECSPQVAVARVSSQQTPFTSDAAKLVPLETFVQWQTSPDDLFVKQEERQ